MVALGAAMSLPLMSSSGAGSQAPAATGRWQVTNNMATGRYGHTATVLSDGQVLVTGGFGCASTYMCASAELYDPTTGTWHPTGSMTVGRAGHTATLLPNGQVLVAGGYGCRGSRCGHLASVELYDPASGRWQLAGGIGPPREYQTATLLPNGRVLVAGGSTRCPFSGCVALAAAMLYTPGPGQPQRSQVVPQRFGQSGSRSSFRCATTPIHVLPLRGNGIPGTPWVQAEPSSSGITGHLFFGNRLLHTNGWMPDGGTTKTYWRLADGQTAIDITGRNLSLGRHAPRLTFRNGILVVPMPGCWRFDLASNRVRAHVTFIVLGD
jgi:hypothetical protein